MKTRDTNTKRILVVDNEPTIRDLYRSDLINEGVETDIAFDVKVA